MMDKTDNNIGTIKIANEVVAIIASLAATEIEGVAGMSGGVGSGIAEILGHKKGVKVEAGEEECVVDLSLIIDYGHSIPEIAEKVQKNVKEAIENMTGLNAVEINVHVQGVRFADGEEIEEVEGEEEEST
ncbi:MAG TPA: Asp23/Gls24 family envelope stress response protein [Halanaerobiales bacterium]|nr:Asp23/Gls24 family envelope stress response protein [Halanaerobiales bacterium]